MLYFKIDTFLLIFLCVLLPLNLLAQEIALNPSSNSKAQELMLEARKEFNNNPSRSQTLAKEAEKLLSSEQDIFLSASLYTLLGNLNGLKLERADKAAEYHKLAFEIYYQLFKDKKISSKQFQDFFVENLTPVYDLLTSENFNRKRRDKKAIREYQALYTELSQFFLQNTPQSNTLTPISTAHHTSRLSLQNNPSVSLEEEKLFAINTQEILNKELKTLYEQYIKELEVALQTKGGDVKALKEKFQSQRQAIEKEIENLQFVIIEKDALLEKEARIAKQAQELLTSQKSKTQAELSLKDANHKQSAIITAAISSVFLLTSIFLLWAYSENHKRKRIAQIKNQKLRQINEELDQFAAKVSHDLRSPISSTLGLLYISKEEKDLSTLQKYMGLMEQSLKRLDEFVNDVLAHSRNTRAELSIAPIELEELLTNTVKKHQFMESEVYVAIHTEIKNPENIFYSDSYRLELIFNNFVGNAIRYADKNKNTPYLKINAEMKPKEVVIRFEDNGLGIREEYQARIFEMFYRADQTRKGSGLGLYIVKQSVDKLGGEIKVHSTFGEGTCFEIRLPNPTVVG